MIRKLEDLYYYSSVIILTLVLLSYFITSGKMPGTEEAFFMPVIAPFESVETSDETTQYYFEGEQLGTENGALVFLTAHQFIEVYSDEHLIFSAAASDPHFGNTTGTRWNFVDVPDGAEQVRVSLTAAYRSSAHPDITFYYGNGSDIYRELMQNSLLPTLLSLLHVVIGVCMIVFWLLINNKAPINRALVFLGMLALCMGGWSFLESDLSMLLLRNRVSASYSAFILLMFMLMPFASFIRELLQTNDTHGWYIIFAYSVANLVLSLVLQALQIVDLKQSQIMTYIGFGLLFAYTVYSFAAAILRRGFTKALRLNLLGMVVLALSLLFYLINNYSRWPLADQLGKVGFTVYVIITGIYTSVSALKQMEEGKKAVYYKELANTDILTGLNNRNAYITDVNSGGFGSNDAVVLFDLNELKKTNDVLGHSAGDRYIKDSAKIISSVFGASGKCYRIGGDEFCVILRSTSEAKIQELIAALKQRQEEYNRVSPSLSMKIACGYAMYEPRQDTDLEAARSRADKKMYQDKIGMKQAAVLPAKP